VRVLILSLIEGQGLVSIGLLRSLPDKNPAKRKYTHFRNLKHSLYLL
jgi:hypothetical protein